MRFKNSNQRKAVMAKLKNIKPSPELLFYRELNKRKMLTKKGKDVLKELEITDFNKLCEFRRKKLKKLK